MDYLFGLTNLRQHRNVEIDKLHISDEAVEALVSRKLNNRLVSELISHTEFQGLLSAIEVYIDRKVEAQIHSMNQMYKYAETTIKDNFDVPNNDETMKILLEIAGLYLHDFAIGYRQKLVAGGRILAAPHYEANDVPVFNEIDANYSERFQRPSKQQAYMNPYSFAYFEKGDNKSPLIIEKFNKPEDVVFAYYAIIGEASNMLGYSGG